MNSNNQMIQKGKISSVEGKADRNGDKTTARVLPSTADSMVTRPLTIPWYLRGEMGNLTPGTEVAYARHFYRHRHAGTFVCKYCPDRAECP